MAETTKTWAQLEQDIADSMRKWRVWDYTIDSPFAQLKAIERRRAMKAGQTVEQRTVTLLFDWRSPATWHAKRGRPIVSRKQDYRLRYIVERSFAWLGNYRRLLIRWEHLVDVYRSWFVFALMLLCVRRCVTMGPTA